MTTRWVRRSAAVVWLLSVVTVLVMAEVGQTASEPPVSVAGFVFGVSVAVTAVLLFGQEDQASNAWWFVALTLAWVANELGGRTVGVFTAPVVWASGFVQVLAAGVLLRYPGRRLDRFTRIYLVTTAVLLGLVQLLLILTSTPDMWKPRKPVDTPWPSLWVDPEVYQALVTTRYTIWAIAAVTFVWLLARRWRRLAQLERRFLLPIMLVGSVTGVLVALRLAEEYLPDNLDELLTLLRTYAGAGVSIAFLASALQMRLAQGVVGVLAAELSQSATVDGVRDSLRRALGDPALEVWYWMPELAAYVDGAGVTQPSPEGLGRLVATVSTTDGQPMAVVLADPSLRRHHALVNASVAVSRLALENAQLQASLKSQLVEVQEARTRLLRAGLEERRRLEKDLHDGAQQRLVALGLRLGMIEGGSVDPATAEAVRAARTDLQEALQELRDLSHGLYPAALSQGGLRPALRSVVARLPLPVHANIEEARWHPDVESAAYLIACEALANACKHAAPRQISLDVVTQGPELVIEVVDDGIGSPRVEEASSLRAIRDRVGAMGGRVEVASSPEAGTRLRATLPT